MEFYDTVDGYYQDIEDGITQAEPRENESDCGFEEVRQTLTIFHRRHGQNISQCTTPFKTACIELAAAVVQSNRKV